MDHCLYGSLSWNETRYDILFFTRINPSSNIREHVLHADELLPTVLVNMLAVPFVVYSEADRRYK